MRGGKGFSCESIIDSYSFFYKKKNPNYIILYVEIGDGCVEEIVY